MVLQQNSSVPIWGWSKKNKQVSINVSWNDKLYSAKSDVNGKWKLNIPTPNAGGPYEVNIITKDTTVLLKDVMIGEVWLASGQSNMQMILAGGGREPV